MTEEQIKTKVGKVYSYHPGYGGGIAGSHRAFWITAGTKYSSLTGKQRIAVPGGGSLLANGFNQGWVHALNMQATGEPITHFAMLHDDIVPDDGWLDQLLDDLLEAQELDPAVDVMSAVVPIKDPMGLTSCAIEGSDPFTVLRRITMTEVFQLPEVFGAEDCGYPEGRLLVNTGCWVCDLTKPWRHSVYGDSESEQCLIQAINSLQESINKSSGMVDTLRYDMDLQAVLDVAKDHVASRKGFLKAFFTIHDRVKHIKNENGQNQWLAEVASEDWNFSRMVQRLGAKVRATRRVRLAHYGYIPYNNNDAWGTCPQDVLLKSRHAGKVIGTPGLNKQRPLDVAGWLTEKEGQELAKLAKDKTVLEIGSYQGRSTIWMAQTAEMVYAVDTFDSRGTPEEGDTLDIFRANLARYDLAHKVVIVKGESKDALPNVESFFDLAFIDGSHDEDSIRTDVQVALRLLKPSGVLALHDYGKAKDVDVKKVVDGMLADGFIFVEQVESVVAIRRSTAYLRTVKDLVQDSLNQQILETTQGAKNGERERAQTTTAGAAAAGPDFRALYGKRPEQHDVVESGG